MKNMKRFIAVLLALLLVFAITGCGGDGDSGGGTEDDVTSGENGDGGDDISSMTIQIGGTVPEDHPLTLALYKFEEEVERMSDGKMQVEVFPNGQLGTGRELTEAVQLGNVHMSECTLSPYSSWTDEFTTLSLPFLFKNRDVAYAFMDSDMAAQMAENVMKDTGVRVLGYWENGVRHLTNSKREVTKPEDMAGLKIRVMETPIYLETFTAMGANPMPMAFGELYTALQQNTIDGQDNPYTIVVTNKFYEIQGYMTDLSHTFDITGFQCNEEWYQNLSSAERAIVDEAAAIATTYQREQAIAAEIENKAIIEASNCQLTELTDEQRAVFREKVEPVYDWFLENCDPNTSLEDVLAEIAKIEADLGL